MLIFQVLFEVREILYRFAIVTSVYDTVTDLYIRITRDFSWVFRKKQVENYKLFIRGNKRETRDLIDRNMNRNMNQIFV